MKFGQQLLESMPQDWKFYFVDYQGLKQYIRLNTQVSGPWNDNHETQFLSMMEDEVKKVSSFETVKKTELQRHVKFLETEIRGIKGTASESAHAQDIKNEMDAVTTDLTKLAKFNSMNYTAFIKIIKKHDKYTGFRLKNTFMTQLNDASFFKETYDDMVVKLSALYEKFLPRDDWQETRIAVQKLNLNRSTYWIHPDNLTEVQCLVLKHLPVLRTAKESPDKGPRARSGLGSLDQVDEDTGISSVYFDTENLDLYTERLTGGGESQTIRVRWFNTDMKHLLVERLKHGEVSGAVGGDRERFSIPEKHLAAYMKGEFDMASRTEKMKKKGTTQKEIDYVIQLAKEIQDVIVAKKLVPVIRTFSRRTVFMMSGQEALSCTIDHEIAMIRELDRTEGGWVRPNIGAYPFDTLPDHEVFKFPFAELTVRSVDLMPDWVNKLCDSHLVEKVQEFSKYLCGCATVVEDRVETIPPWLSLTRKDIRKSPKDGASTLLDDGDNKLSAKSSTATTDEATDVFNMERRASLAYTGGQESDSIAIPSKKTAIEDDEEEEGEMGSLRNRKLRNLKLLSGLLTRFPTTVPSVSRAIASKPAQPYRKPIAIPVRVEPKVFFANERTFLHWTKVSVVISTLGLALLHAPASQGNAARAAGYIMVPIAMIVSVYALYTFFWRDYKINHRDPGPYSAPAGPFLVTVTFGFSMLLNYFMWLYEHGGTLTS